MAATIGSIENIAAQASSRLDLPATSPEVTSPLPTDNEAARFLAQATFGPTLVDIAHLRSIGYQAWLDEQFNAPVSLEVPYLAWLEKLDNMNSGGGIVRYFDDNRRLESWLINAIGGLDPSPEHSAHNDQLRQRVAFALSELFVVSAMDAKLGLEMWGLASFYDVLANNAFGNYRTLLEEVTKHPVMGTYLSMIRNQKADPSRNIHPDENYAREVMQLFSIGLYQLNADGTNQLQNGQPIPTYDQSVVRSLAAVFTGWTWGEGSGCNRDNYPICENNTVGAPVWLIPMQPIEEYHDNTSDKQLLNYPGVALPKGVLMHGGDAQTELTAALDNIFQHPNVGPFIAKFLIQRLVTSNPSPA